MESFFLFLLVAGYSRVSLPVGATHSVKDEWNAQPLSRAFTLGGVALTYWLAEELWWLVLTLYSLDALLIGEGLFSFPCSHTETLPSSIVTILEFMFLQHS